MKGHRIWDTVAGVGREVTAIYPVSHFSGVNFTSTVNLPSFHTVKISVQTERVFKINFVLYFDLLISYEHGYHDI